MANLRVNQITTGTGSYHGSIYASGTGAYLLTTVTAPGTDDFTIECYINSDNASGTNQEGVFAINAQSGGFQSGSSNQLRLVQGRDGTDGQNGGLEVSINGTQIGTGDGNDIIQEGTWHHVAVTRASGTVKIWVDGVEKASGSAAGNVTGTTFITGYYDSGYTYQGFMSNFRYRKGTAHYTTTFTAPTKPLERTTDTELIFAQSPHNAGNGFSSAIHGGTTDIMQVNGNVTANSSSPTQLSDTSGVGVVFNGPIKQNTQGYMYFQSGITEERGGTRALMIGGFSPGGSDTINFVNVATEGTALDFGNLSRAAGYCGAMGGRTRGVIPLQYQMTPSEATTNIIEFLTILTEGNTQDFGDMATSTYGRASASNDVRGIISGGEATEDAMEFITLASLGNGSSFGDLTQGRREPQSTADPTRMVTAGGYASPSTGTRYNIIDFVTIATTGNAQDFGDLTVTRWKPAACADATRGVFAGGGTPSNLNVIDFITIQSTGDATDFGDLVLTSKRGSAGSDSIRGVIFTGFSDTGSHTANIDSIIIQTTGSAKRFGETTTDTHSTGGLSNGHGGLS